MTSDDAVRRWDLGRAGPNPGALELRLALGTHYHPAARLQMGSLAMASMPSLEHEFIALTEEQKKSYGLIERCPKIRFSNSSRRLCFTQTEKMKQKRKKE